MFLSDELWRKKFKLKIYKSIIEKLCEEIMRNVCESVEMKKVLEVIYNKIRSVYIMINKDI